jgi:hypothetical protein
MGTAAATLAPTVVMAVFRKKNLLETDMAMFYNEISEFNEKRKLRCEM